jgi:hypothetical protein
MKNNNKGIIHVKLTGKCVRNLGTNINKNLDKL